MFFKSLLAIGAVCLGTAGLAAAQGQIHLPPLVSQGPEAGRVPVVTTKQLERERGIKWQQDRRNGSGAIRPSYSSCRLN